MDSITSSKGCGGFRRGLGGLRSRGLSGGGGSRSRGRGRLSSFRNGLKRIVLGRLRGGRLRGRGLRSLAGGRRSLCYSLGWRSHLGQRWNRTEQGCREKTQAS